MLNKTVAAAKASLKRLAQSSLVVTTWAYTRKSLLFKFNKLLNE